MKKQNYIILSFFLLAAVLMNVLFVNTFPRTHSVPRVLTLMLFANAYVFFVFRKSVHQKQSAFLQTLFYLFSFTAPALMIIYAVGISTYSVIHWTPAMRTGGIGSIIILLQSFMMAAFPLIIAKILRFFKYIKQKKSIQFNEISYSPFLLMSSVLLGFLVLISSLFFAFFRVTAYKTNEVEITDSRVPKGFDNYRIVQISDAHIGSFTSTKPLEKLVSKINQLNPDLVVFTGDIVNYSAFEMLPYLDVLKSIQAKDGVFAIRGNHDYGNYLYWKHPEDSLKMIQNMESSFQKINWHLMKNESVILHRNADSIVLCGTENFAPKRKPNDKHAIQNGDFTKTFTNVDTSDFIVLLTHDPGAFDSVVQKKYPFVALTLSGHTHGAQIGISYKHFSRSLLSLKGGHWGGLYKEGNQYLYINVGFGFNVFPFRIGMPPEITLLTLKHKDEQPIGFK